MGSSLRIGRRSRVIFVLLALALGYGALVFLAWAFQRRMIYLPSGEPGRPVDHGLAAAEEISLETADGLSLGGWFLPAGRETGTTVLVCNGNGGNRAFRTDLAASLARLGVATMLFDYRGYGGNPGSPSEEGLALDARAALAALRSRPDVDASRIVYLGESLGAAVCLRLAIEEPPAALILRSPFTSMVDAGSVHYPFLPVSLLLRDRYPSLDRIGGLTAPLLVIAGDRDRVIPVEQSRRLFAAAPEPKWMLEIPGGYHNDLGRTMIDGIARFLADSQLLAADES